jgi:isopentenyl diphosphate isomerase/L-lactate dehydrogenase-like FMN-dependent dehydrogenase
LELSEIYGLGASALQKREFGWLLSGVETEFVLTHNRRVLDRYTISQRCIDGVEPVTGGTVLGVSLKTPIIMSAMTMPIPAIADDGLMAVAKGLKEAGSLLWTGTPIPHDLAEIVATGVAVAANVKPLKNRDKMFAALDEIQAAGVNWVGVEIDSGQGTKIHDRQVTSDCSPLSLQELKDIRSRVSAPLVFKGVLSWQDAEKSLEAGADALFVSNHGAHTLDYLPHPFQVMDEVMEVARGRAVIIVDGGFRRGSDVFKGLAFGARLVGLGRPILYGLAAAGAEGVRDVIRHMTEELRRFMAMTGSVDPEHVNRDLLVKN